VEVTEVDVKMRRACLQVAVFLVGFGIMGFEMVASRMMTPWFGGGIDTWAALISTVLTGLMAGYFAGGRLPARWKTERAVSALIVGAAFYMAVVPVLNADVLRGLALRTGQGAGVLLLSAFLLCFVPVTLLGMFSPCSVDLMVEAGAHQSAGAIAGQLYGISTLGSVFGTLATAFVLIPRLGSDNIALVLAGANFVAGGLVWASRAGTTESR
jgi:predicted membrane-bound spermidine synthase